MSLFLNKTYTQYYSDVTDHSVFINLPDANLSVYWKQIVLSMFMNSVFIKIDFNGTRVQKMKTYS